MFPKRPGHWEIPNFQCTRRWWIHEFYSYVQIPGVWDTGNRKLPVSGTLGITIPGVPDTCEMQIANVQVIGEMRNANVRDTGESGIASVQDTGMLFFDCSLVF